jgi:hypothetical protein
MNHGGITFKEVSNEYKNAYMVELTRYGGQWYPWPWFEPTHEKLQSYKVNETVRCAVFTDVVEGKSERIAEIKELASATVKLWEQFQERYMEVA